MRVEPFPVTTGSPCRTCRVCSVLLYKRHGGNGAQADSPSFGERGATPRPPEERLFRQRRSESEHGTEAAACAFPRARRPRTTERPRRNEESFARETSTGRDGAPGIHRLLSPRMSRIMPSQPSSAVTAIPYALRDEKGIATAGGDGACRTVARFSRGTHGKEEGSRAVRRVPRNGWRPHGHG